MFGLFKKKSEYEKLEEKYKKLLQEAFELSTSSRAKSDEKQAEAELVLREMEKLRVG
jgi:TRAP-type mannitol/chloroaromatic compound transport system substrate-binding protein